MTSQSFSLFSKSALPALLSKSRTPLDVQSFIAAANVFPMRINNHVAENLIDWGDVANDPMFRLSIPQPDMLKKDDLDRLLLAMRDPGGSRIQLRAMSEAIRRGMNPHPAGQKEENVPWLDGTPVPGIQHKYRETALFFPSEGQYCHAYCTYCFRWAQFTSVGSEQAFKSSERDMIVRYLRQHPTIHDVLFTGGDPMVMPAATLRHYMEPLFGPGRPPNLNTIRIGTKSLAWWPRRYLTDVDSSAVLKLFADIVASGTHLTIQAHFSHPREVEDPRTQEAVRLIRMTGAQIRSQAPLIKRINDNAEVWESMWKTQTKLGIIPYYMFMERDTGAQHYFSVPLARAHGIFRQAISRLPGTARTARGPSMSASPGKICVLGDVHIRGEHCFALQFLQSRNPDWNGRIFFARFDPTAIWFDDLKPAFGEEKFFFERQYQKQKDNYSNKSSGQLCNADWDLLQ